MDKEDLKLLLRLLCALGDIDQDTLSARAGVSATTLWRYGAGEMKPRPNTLDRLTGAVGLRWAHVEQTILPVLREWRLTAAHSQAEGSDPAASSILDLAARLGKWVRARVAAEADFASRGERDSCPGDPRPEDRGEAEFLASCLEGATAGEVDFLLRESPELRSWVLVEHLCHRSASPEPGAQPPVELAELASRIARQLPGPEPWQSRVQAYAEAFLGRALAQAGEPNAATLSWASAEVLWDRGADPHGLLSEQRFREATREVRP